MAADVADNANNTVEIKGFNGNRIRVTYAPGGGTFGTDSTVTVDNVKPSVVTTSPSIPLIARGATDITFSADIADNGSGFTAKDTDFNGDALTGAQAALASQTAIDTGPVGDGPPLIVAEGGVRLVVAGNVVGLSASNFEKIDDGWRVTRTIGSSSIQSISANVPWYFEAADRANNKQRTSGTATGKADAGGDAGDNDERVSTLTDDQFAGNLNGNTFVGSSLRVTRGEVVSNVQKITVFTGIGGGVFSVPNTAADPLFGAAAVEGNGDIVAVRRTGARLTPTTRQKTHPLIRRLHQ